MDQWVFDRLPLTDEQRKQMFDSLLKEHEKQTKKKAFLKHIPDCIDEDRSCEICSEYFTMESSNDIKADDDVDVAPFTEEVVVLHEEQEEQEERQEEEEEVPGPLTLTRTDSPRNYLN